MDLGESMPDIVNFLIVTFLILNGILLTISLSKLKNCYYKNKEVNELWNMVLDNHGDIIIDYDYRESHLWDYSLPNIFLNFSLQTMNTASYTIFFDILELPAWRSMKMIGTSTILSPFSIHR